MQNALLEEMEGGDNMKKGLNQSVTMSVRQDLSQTLCQKLTMTPRLRRKISEEELKERVIVPKKTKKT